ncbi:MAG: DUF5689 domain-containing protein [Bacteroides sp.]|nr:DUF5689 domain-containing protein [Bacteroides sp.]
MKSIQKITAVLLALIAFVSCQREYDAPPLNVPVYDGPKANITISQLKERAKVATPKDPFVIVDDLVLRAYVSANDEGGNIYNQIFIQDKDAAIQVQVNKGNIGALYRRGQEVFINLKGMSISIYGGEMQLGWPEASNSAFRIPYEIFEKRFLKNNWADEKNVTPLQVEDLSALNADVAGFSYKLVQLNKIHFVNGGKETFGPADKFKEEVIKDEKGNSIVVRTSAYASFAGEKLPVGKGSIVGILGRFNGKWQFTIPTIKDVKEFDGVPVVEEGETPTDPEDAVLFAESFGTPAKVENKWPLLEKYDKLDNEKSMYAFAEGTLDVRSTKTFDGHLWFKANADISFKINNVKNKGAKKGILVYKLASNLFTKTGEEPKTINVNVFEVKFNDTSLQVPSKELKTGGEGDTSAYEVRIENIDLKELNSIEFMTKGATNPHGFRLLDVKLITKSSEIIKPEGE